MYQAWIVRRLQIKNIIKECVNAKILEVDIYKYLGVYDINDTEFNTYKAYIWDVTYENQMQEAMRLQENMRLQPKGENMELQENMEQQETVKLQETKTQTTEIKKYDLNTVRSSDLKTTLKITELCADGSCIPKLGAKGYARVTDQDGKPLLQLFDLSDYKAIKMSTPKGELDAVEVYSEDTPNQQINYAEITALHLALKIALFLDIKIINIDSITSNAWSSNRISKSIKDIEKMRICKEATLLRAKFEGKGGSVRKIDGGKNPADFGYH